MSGTVLDAHPAKHFLIGIGVLMVAALAAGGAGAQDTPAQNIPAQATATQDTPAQDTSASGPVPAAAAALSGGCFVAPARLSDADMQVFLADPAALLADYPSAGLPMTTRVRSLAGSSATTLDPLLGLVASASPPQVSAIGSGLARVARACAASNPDYAGLIQQKIAGLNNPQLVAAFLAASSEVQTAALGAASSAAGGAGGAIGGGGAGAAGGSSGLGTIATASGSTSSDTTVFSARPSSGNSTSDDDDDNSVSATQ